MRLNHIDLNKLNVFFAVAEEGGVAAAAQKLNLSASAVSQSLSTLEASLGFGLFRRMGRRLIPTSRGETLYSRFRDYHRALGRALREMGLEAAEARGPVRLGLFLGFSRARLTSFLAGFLESYPGIQAKLLFASQSELIGLLSSHRIDLALSIKPLSGASPRVASRKLFREDLILVAAKKLSPSRLTEEDILRLPIVDYYQGGQLIDDWYSHHFGKKARPGSFAVRAYGAAVDYVLELILREVGAGVVPRHVAAPHLSSGRLIQVSTGGPELSDHVWLNEIQGAAHEPQARLFRERLVEAFGAGLNN